MSWLCGRIPASLESQRVKIGAIHRVNVDPLRQGMFACFMMFHVVSCCFFFGLYSCIGMFWADLSQQFWDHHQPYLYHVWSTRQCFSWIHLEARSHRNLVRRSASTIEGDEFATQSVELHWLIMVDLSLSMFKLFQARCKVQGG